MSMIFRFPGILAAVPDTAPPVSFQAIAVDTAGGTARWNRGADLTGNADGKQFFFSMWVKPDALLNQNLATTGGNEINVWLTSAGRIQLLGENAAGATILLIQSPISSIAVGSWQHIAGSIDMADITKRWMRVNGVLQTLTITTYTDDTINFTVGNYSIGANPAGGAAYGGALAEIWIDHQFIADTNIIDKFVTAGGFPIDLGATGTTPGFGQPIVYLSRRNGVSDFAANKGTGGGFTVVGTPGDGGLLPSGGSGGPGSPSSWDDTVITTRAPKLYLPMEVASGNPVDNSASGLTATMNGAPTAYQVATEKGLGINLGGTADILVNDNIVFRTDHGIARNVSGHPWVYSEVCVCGQFKINSFLGSPSEDAYLFGKSGDPVAWAHSLNVYVTTNGRLRIDARTPWRHVRLESQNSAITTGVEFHVNVVLGREGLWATLNGRMLNNGEKDPRHWYGWDHRVRGFSDFNAGAIRIGKSSTGNRADIVVSKFAVFVTGTYANRFDITDAQALAGGSGAALGHPLFDLTSENVAVGGNIQTAIDARAAAGGGTVVLAAGTHTRSTDLMLKTGVRLKGAGVAGTTINLTSGASIKGNAPSAGTARYGPSTINYSFPGPLAAGQTSITATNTLTDDAILIVVANRLLGDLFQPPSPETHVMAGEFVPIWSRTGSVFNLEGGLMFAYGAGDQRLLSGFNPLVKDCEVTDLSITGDLRTNASIGLLHFEGARRVFIRRVNVTEGVAYSGDPGKLTNIVNCYGCVDFVMEDVEWKSNSSFGAYLQTGAFHPYAAQYLGGTNNIVMRGYGHANDWTMCDVGTDNFDQEWPGATNDSYHVCAKRLEAIDCIGSTQWFHGPWGGHMSAECRFIGCESSQGGWAVGGWRAECRDFLSHFPVLPGFPPDTSRLPAGTLAGDRPSAERYVCNLVLEGVAQRWFDMPDRNSLYVDVHHAGADNTGAGPQAHQACIYVNVDAPLPPSV